MRDWLALVLLVAVALPARGLTIMGPPPGRTVEWFVADSDLIVRGTIRAVSDREVGPGNTFSTVTVEVVETYKGPAAAGEEIKFMVRNGGVRGLLWAEERLFFLVNSKRHIESRPAAKELEAGWSGAPWAMRDYVGLSIVPVNGQPAEPIYSISEGARLVGGGREIIEAVRKEVARGPTHYRGEFEIKLSPSSELRKARWRSDSTIVPEYTVGGLVIPLDERAEAMAKKWVKSTDPYDRHNAVRVLAEFRSDENAALLRGLLDDPFESDRQWPGPWSSWGMMERPGKWRDTRYPIRQLAWYLLKTWGAAPADAVIGKPLYPGASLRPWQVIGGTVALVVLALALLLRGWRTGGRKIRAVAGFGGVCGVLLLVVTTFWIRSRWRIDELVLRGGNESRIEWATLPGGVRLMVIEKWSDPFPITFTSVPRSDQALQDWQYQDGSTPVPGRKGQFGFYRDSGAITGPGLGRGAVYRAWTMPYWGMAAVLGVPVVWRGWRLVQRWRAPGEGYCPNCGYDLRATPGRCPECGRGFG